jgi:glycerol-3-phosphate acyltransferase PlsY
VNGGLYTSLAFILECTLCLIGRLILDFSALGPVIVAAYLIGSISFAVIVSKIYGLPDPRTFGSKNPGATNMLRGGNKQAALITLIGDTAKGMLAVWIALQVVPVGPGQDTALALVTLAAFLGHIFPLFFGFQGGKGVATAAGLLLMLCWPVGLASLCAWVGVFWFTRVSSMGALAATLTGPVVGYVLLGMSSLWMSMVVMAILLLWRHRTNIQKLMTGEEAAFKPRPK